MSPIFEAAVENFGDEHGGADLADTGESDEQLDLRSAGEGSGGRGGSPTLSLELLHMPHQQM